MVDASAAGSDALTEKVAAADTASDTAQHDAGQVDDHSASGATGAGETGDATTERAGLSATAATSASDAGPTATVDRPASTPAAEPTRRVGALPAGDATRAAPPPTSLMPAAPVSPAPARGTVFTAGKLQSERTRRAVLVGALVCLLLLGLVVAVPLLTSGDGERETPQDAARTSESSAPATSAPASPSPTATAEASPSTSPSPSETAGGLPAGWTLRTDPVGFKVAVPDGWRRSSGSTWVKYQEPNGVSELTIDRTNSPGKDAAEAWRGIESGRKNVRGVRNYQLIEIKPFDCKWRTCADWDWRQTRNGVQLRVRNRGFVTASNRGFALRWEVPNKDWEAQLDNFEMVFRTFVPDRQD
ncbi:hypothetical protein C1I95_30815 [Micromonospora craterilacus]|uniref:Serine/threonine protein kinase n=1 Tax=Micromonospora craterilacus TaxID=1655439 RepID=A0A2W2E6I4_9ACTN|nr:hypothetical protein C1I95_30815 [Micromonospora craterilacus]